MPYMLFANPGPRAFINSYENLFTVFGHYWMKNTIVLSVIYTSYEYVYDSLFYSGTFSILMVLILFFFGSIIQFNINYKISI